MIIPSLPEVAVEHDNNTFGILMNVHVHIILSGLTAVAF